MRLKIAQNVKNISTAHHRHTAKREAQLTTLDWLQTSGGAKRSWTWWACPEISELGRQKQDRVISSLTESLELAWAT